MAPATWAQDLPTGGTVVDGSASISGDATSVTIDQTSDRVVIDWADFDIAQGNRVDFRQPGADAWALNRDLSGAASHIDGILSANGNVVLQNRHGVHIGGTAQIEVNSIIATTHNIENADFMAGDMTFGIPGESGATVTNAGSITVEDGGLAALVAPAVSNSGTVMAREGTVVLAAGETSTYDFYGDGLINIAVTTPTTEVPVGPDGQPVDALVGNPGAVYADGGTVILTVSQVESVVVNAINMDGFIQANSVDSADGQVALVSDTGAIAVSGTVTADGTSADQSGGTVQIAGAAVEIAPTAMVSASGPGAGGAVLIGADDTAADRALGVSSGQGDGLLISLDRTLAELGYAPATQTVTVEDGADIAADGGTGDGGHVDVWANNALLVAGTVTADSTEAAGGDVTMTADAVTLIGAFVSASGADQGGEVLIGGGFRGEGTLAHATTTFVDADSTVSAVATDAAGTGGTVVLWSTDATGSAGTLLAGPSNGLIEVSSTGSVGLTGTVDAGLGGTFLLDPTFVVIEANGTALLDEVDQFAKSGDSLSVDPSTITAALDVGTSVTIQATTDITVTDAISSTNTGTNNGGNSGDLVFQAGRHILIRANISLENGNFTATANDTTSNADLTARTDTTPGNITMSTDTSIDVGSGTVTLTIDPSATSPFAPGAITIADITGSTVILSNAAGSVTSQAGGSVTASLLDVTAVNAGVIAYNATSSDLRLNLTGNGNFDLSGSDAVNVFGTVSGALSLLGDDAVSINVGDENGNTGLTVGGDFAVNTIAGMTQTAVLKAGALTGSSYGDVILSLSTQDNKIGRLMGFSGLIPTGGVAPERFELRARDDLDFGDPNNFDPNDTLGLSGFTTVNLDIAGYHFAAATGFASNISAAALSILAKSAFFEFEPTVNGATLFLNLTENPAISSDNEINLQNPGTETWTVNVYGQVTNASANPNLIIRSDGEIVLNIGDGGGRTVGLTVDGTLDIDGEAGITQDDPIKAAALSFSSLGDVDLYHGLNDVDRLLASGSALGDVTLTDADDLELDGAVMALGTLTLNVGGALTDSDGTVVIDGLEVPNPNGGGYLLAPFVNVNAASAGAFGAPIRIHARPDSEFLAIDLETLSLDLTRLFDPVVTLGLSGDGFFDFLVTNDTGLPTSLDDLLPTDPVELEAFKADNPELFDLLQTIDFEIGVRTFNVAGTVSNGSDLTLTGGEAPLVFNNTVLDAGDGSVLLVIDDGDDSNSDPALTVDGTLTLNDFVSVTQADDERLVAGELEGFVLGDITLPELSNDIDALGTLVSVGGAIDIDTLGDVELTGVVYSSVLVDLFLLGGLLTNESEDGPLSPFLPDGVLAPRFNLRASGAGSQNAGINVLALPNITDGPILDLLPAGTFDDPIVDLVNLSQDSFINLVVINTNPVTVNGVPYLQTDTGFDTTGFAPLTFGDRTFNVFGSVRIGEGDGPSLTLNGGETSTVNFLGDLPVLFDNVPTVSDLLEVVLGGAITNSPYAFTGTLPAFEEIAGDGSVVVNIGDGGDGTEGLLVDNVLTINNALRIIQDDVLTVRTLTGSTIGDGTVILTAFGNTVRNLGDFDTGNGDFSLATLSDLELAGLVSNGLGTTTLTVDLDLTDEESNGFVDAIRSAALVVTAIDAGSSDAPINYQSTGSRLELDLNGDGFFDLSSDPGVPAVDVLGRVARNLALDGGNTVTVNIGSDGTGLTVGGTLSIADVAAVTQSAGLLADTLAGDTGGGSIDLSLDGVNDIDSLDSLSTGNGDLALSDIDGVELVGLVDAGTGQVVLVLGGDLTAGDNGSVQSAALILTGTNAGSDLAPIVYTATGSQLELDLSGDGTFVLDGETTNVYGFVDGILAVFSDATTMNIGDGDGTLLEGPGEGALVIGESFTTAVSELTEEDCLFVAGDGPCGALADFLPTTPTTPTTTLDTPSILLITFGDEAFDPTLGVELLTPGDAAFRTSEFRTPTVANLFDRPFPLGPNAPADPTNVTGLDALEPAAGGADPSDLSELSPAAGPSEETCVSAFFGDFWNVEEACQ